MGAGPDEIVPDTSETGDDFIAPGGVVMPEHLNLDNFGGVIGHLLANPLQLLSVFADVTAMGKVPDSVVAGHARTARREIMKTVDYLLDRYGADIDMVKGLREFLVQFRREVEEFRWEEAVATYRQARQDLHF